MGAFVTPHVDLRYFSQYNMRLLDSFTYGRNNGDVISCARGFATDLASVPLGLSRAIIPKLGKHTKAAIIHDGLYRAVAIVYNKEGEQIEYTRRESDKAFREAMKDEGEGFVQRWIIYAAVRVGGRKAWQFGHHTWLDGEPNAPKGQRDRAN